MGAETEIEWNNKREYYSKETTNEMTFPDYSLPFCLTCVSSNHRESMCRTLGCPGSRSFSLALMASVSLHKSCRSVGQSVYPMWDVSLEATSGPLKRSSSVHWSEASVNMFEHG